jgi:DNA replication protein DnaC
MEKKRGTWPAFLKRLGRMELLVLDDFALERADSHQSHALREILDLRRRHGSAVLIASPNAPEDWDGLFDDAAAAEAIFGRVLERSQRITLGRPAR